MKRVIQILVGVALVLILSGCAPRVRILDVDARRVQSDGQLQAIAFTTTAKSSGLAGQQLIYQVRLLDARMRPLRSRDNKFRNAAGEVAATKSLMVFDSPWRLENVTIAIPADELEVAPGDLPVGAEFAMIDASGEVLDTAFQQLPLYNATIEGSGPVPAYARRDAPPQEPAYARRDAPEGPAYARREAPPERAVEARRETPRPAPEPAPAPSPAPTRERYVERTPAPAQQRVAPAAPRPVPRTEPSAPPVSARPDAPMGDGSSDALYRAIRAERAEEPAQAEPARREGSVPPWSRRPVARSGREQILSRDDAASPSKVPPRIYVVQKGDTLTRVARRIYGDSDRWIELFEYNRHQLDSPDLIYEGLELLVPPGADERPE